MKWQNTTLGKLIDVKHGFAFKGEFFSDAGEYILLTPGNCFEKGGLKLNGDKEKYYTGDFPREYILSIGDMLIVMTDLVGTAPVLGGAFKIPENNLFLHNQRLGLINILNEQVTDKDFLYYLLNSHNYRGQIRGSASGATVRHTSPGRIKKCKIKIPSDKSIQQRIGEILFSYDDLIDTNRRRIQLLEESARLLFREWFVYFRFPGHEKVHPIRKSNSNGVKFVDGVPEGWKRVHLEDLVETQYGYTETATDEEIGPKFLRGMDINKNSYIDWSAVPYCTEQGLNFEKYALSKDDIVVIRMADPGKVAIIEKNITAIFASYLVRLKIKPNSPLLPYFLFYKLSNEQYQGFIANASTGSTRQSASAKLLVNFHFVLPPLSLQEMFNDYIIHLRAQMNTLLDQNAALKKARDLLLPRLMNGEIEV